MWVWGGVGVGVGGWVGVSGWGGGGINISHIFFSRKSFVKFIFLNFN